MIDLSGLDEDQRRAATAPRGPVCIVAGAGTGKTRTITYRIAHLIDQQLVSPQRVLAVTFTNKAAREMRERLKQMGIPRVQASTFHSAASRQLRYFWPLIAGRAKYEFLTNSFSLVARAMRSTGIETNTDTIRDILGEIDWAKSMLITASQYPERVLQAHRTPPIDPEKVAQIYQRYEDAKFSGSEILLDYSDILLQMVGAIENSRAVAEEFRSQYNSFIVDEYQDVTPLQQRLLEVWLGDRDDLTVVGDANQTIYSFTGATPDYLLDFSRTYPNAVVVKLQRDYRSTPQIADTANRLISQARGRVAGTKVLLEGMLPAGPQPCCEGYADDTAEAQGVVQHIKKCVAEGTKLEDIAILYRINAQSEVFEQALADAGLSYHVKGGTKFFERKEIQTALNALVKAAAHPQRWESLAPHDLFGQVTAVLAMTGHGSKAPEGAQARERWQMVNSLQELCRDLAQHNPQLDLAGLVRKLYERSQSHTPRSFNAVTLASMHEAKGLEWETVFLVGLSENLLPISHAIKAGQEAIEEERRLLYVGMTRARTQLFLSWASARREGGKAVREPSRFLNDVAAHRSPVASGATGARISTWGRPTHCSACGKKLTSPADKVLGHHQTCGQSVDDAVFHALRSWRAATARQMNVPAYIVFSDATLLAIAESMPSSLEELLTIPGVGPVKIDRFGTSLVGILDQFR